MFIHKQISDIKDIFWAISASKKTAAPQRTWVPSGRPLQQKIKEIMWRDKKM